MKTEGIEGELDSILQTGIWADLSLQPFSDSHVKWAQMQQPLPAY